MKIKVDKEQLETAKVVFERVVNVAERIAEEMNPVRKSFLTG